MKNRRINLGVLFLAAGAVIGALEEYDIERSSLIYIFSGKPSRMAAPSEPYYRHSHPMVGKFPKLLGFQAAAAIQPFIRLH